MRISLGDVSLWFDVSGPSVIPQGDTTVERQVLVAVHGGPGLDHMTVKSALGPLAEDVQVLYFDLRGHGRSDHSSAPPGGAGQDPRVAALGGEGPGVRVVRVGLDSRSFGTHVVAS